jgi:ribonuclease HII
MNKLKRMENTPPKLAFKWLIGIDEVGRGPVAGPVAVCAAIIPFDDMRESSNKIKDYFNIEKTGKKLPQLRDSKKLTEKGREVWYEELIKKESSNIEFELNYCSAQEIDKHGIAVCIKSLVNKNLHKLKEKIKFNSEEVLVLLDGGLKAPEEYINQETIIKGDDKEPIISAASIYAKVSRDRMMKKLSVKFPLYSLEKHKGYGTKLHIDLIIENGPCELHRLTFLRSVLNSM